MEAESNFDRFNRIVKRTREVDEATEALAAATARISELEKENSDLGKQLCMVIPLSRQRQERVEKLERMLLDAGNNGLVIGPRYVCIGWEPPYKKTEKHDGTAPSILAAVEKACEGK